MAKRFEYLKLTLLTTIFLVIIRFPSPDFLLHNDCFHIIREHMIRRRGKNNFVDCKSADCVKPDAKCWLLETIVVASGGPYIQSHDSFKITYFRPKAIQSDIVLAMCGYFFMIILKRYTKVHVLISTLTQMPTVSPDSLDLAVDKVLWPTVFGPNGFDQTSCERPCNHCLVWSWQSCHIHERVSKSANAGELISSTLIRIWL